MTDLYNDIMGALEEAVAYAKGQETGAIVHEVEPLDIKAIRHKVNMTQEEFANAVGVKLPTLRHWERGDRKPTGPARVLLNLLSREPDTVLRLLHFA
ncbi:helix-turn-helix domain-containing protein [Thalassotalea sp. G20_0]|uniref:NadS family protein n=1 Tax=Thalassotalea sp. G20_0 TaxID=2821093 RepID=UPI001ADABB68|nr:NadS family protein [Thalassotalea sp. G20_0]MBO9497746.1 helix-turn-helix domain-containing protein [Thalassotalea sp. G20_0]